MCGVVNLGPSVRAYTGGLWYGARWHKFREFIPHLLPLLIYGHLWKFRNLAVFEWKCLSPQAICSLVFSNLRELYNLHFHSANGWSVLGLISMMKFLECLLIAA